ncbi:MAG TPA: hypothetical protein VN688_29335 [Gemmataceae bacterium]|nr:hypothetical protein [Gemmataceae bacterium]
MTINLPNDLEHFIRAEVHRGQFASEDDAIAEAVRLLRRQLSQTPKIKAADATAPDPVLGVMRDAADEMDEIAAAAMRHRELQPWRLSPDE